VSGVPAAIDVGFYGKLPSHGDFLRRRVPDEFVSVWDAWMQECLLESRNVLGGRWLEVYLTSPLWRFTCAPGVFGQQSAIGLMAPSVDRVGRYFHLTFLAALPRDVDPLLAVLSSDSFFARAEQLALETLAAERIDFDAFDQRVGELGSDLAHLVDRASVRTDGGTAAAVLAEGIPPRRRLGLGATGGLGGIFQLLCARRLTSLYDPLVAWWTDGSQYVEPSLLIGQGLPPPQTFAALLTGTWAEQGWRALSMDVDPSPESDTAEAPAIESAPPRYSSAGASDVGKVRSVNQDSFLERPDAGLWAVADGLGGHNHGEVASRMVCDALADLAPAGNFDETVAAARGLVKEVNTRLRLEAERAQDPIGSGSTIVALLTQGSRYAVLWAGDSRVYRLRAGRMEQLTSDHSAGELDESGNATSAITRAVGAESELVLDLHRGHVSAGDRFLLCSDGLTRIVPPTRIQELMGQESTRAAVDCLLQATLEAGAPDNVTVVIVDAYA
jgi:type VI secretion system protein ImpM